MSFRLAAVWPAALSLAGLSSAGCHHARSTITVAVVFDAAWKLGTANATDAEKSLVRQTALETLRSAYEGFDVRFEEAPTGRRVIRIEDTPFRSDIRLEPPVAAVGLTYAASTSSSVRMDVMISAELASVRCHDIDHCSKTRMELLQGLGTGIGATAAHELGHQAGFYRFALDSPCGDCYDGHAATSYVHFFGRKHWSPGALEIMRRVLPPDTRTPTPRGD